MAENPQKLAESGLQGFLLACFRACLYWVLLSNVNMHGVLHSFCAIYFCFINHLFGIFVQSHTMNRGSRVLCLVLQNLVILVNLFRGLNTLRPNQGPQSFSRDQKRFFKLVLHCQGQIRTSCKNCKTTQNIFNSLFGHGHVKMPFGVTHASYPYQSVSFNLINSSKTKTF